MEVGILTQLDEIYSFVENRCLGALAKGNKVGVQISAVAEHFGIWQGETTEALNALAAQGRLAKRGVRPILYYPVELLDKAVESKPKPTPASKAGLKLEQKECIKINSNLGSSSNPGLSTSQRQGSNQGSGSNPGPGSSQRQGSNPGPGSSQRQGSNPGLGSSQRQGSNPSLGASQIQGVSQRQGSNPGTVSRAQALPPFAKLIGFDGSLKYQTQMASVAVSYPPNGIHTLIIGKTGVGKSLLASEMGRYMSELRGKKMPFIAFNCAEYSDNPQLLLAQLFGYARGAFTGADNDKPGLIEYADMGIMFLDELHRLPPTGQEMLFTLIDEGYYRRLGDTANRTARIMIVGATTENPSNFLLNTFKRRIPFTIQLPELGERPVNERIDIITSFIHEEAKRLGLPIRVSYQALKLLVSFKGKNNIGDLRNEIRMACAQSNWAYGKQAKSVGLSLNLDIYNFSRNLSIKYSPDEHADAYFLSAGLGDGIEINCESPPALSPSFNNTILPLEFHSFVKQKMFVYRGLGKDVSEAERLVVADLEKQFTNHSQSTSKSGVTKSNIIYGSIAPVVWQVTNELIQYASVEFNKAYDKETIGSIAYYLQQLVSYATAGRTIFNPDSFESISGFPKEKAFVIKMAPILKNLLNIDLMDGEIILLAMLFAHKSRSKFCPAANLLLCGYANSASAIAAFANSMLNTNFVRALDMPDNSDPIALRSKIYGALGSDFRDTLILCGFNISSILVRALSKDSLLYFRTLPVLDPMIVLECARMILMTNMNIDDITASLMNEYKGYMDAAMNDMHTTIHPTADESSVDTRDVIVTYCITGVGSARVVREMLLRDLAVATSIDILPLGIKDDIVAIAHKLGRRLKLIIGVMNPDIPGIPYVSIEQFLNAGVSRDLLRSKGIVLPLDSEIEVEDLTSMPLDVQLNHIRDHLYYFAPSLDVKKVDKSARNIIEKIVQLYKMPLPPDLIVRIYNHCATMFERISTADPIPMPLDGYAAIEQENGMFQKLEGILNSGADKLGLSVSDAEVYYLMITLPQSPAT